MHPLLKRRLDRLGLDPETPPDALAWQRLIARVDASYAQADQTRELVERSMTLSSQEMRSLHDRLQRANDELEDKVRERTSDLERLNESLGRQIEERRSTEAALAASERWIRLVNDNLPVMIAYVDADEVYRYHNRAFSAWLGIATGQIVGRPVRELMGAEVYAAIAPNIRAVLAGRRVSFERVHRKPGREIEHLACEFLPDVGEGGKVLGYYAMLLDVTARKRAEHRAVENEARFRSLTELSSDWYWEQDAQFRFVSTAGRTQDRGGITAEVHVGKCRWELPGTEPESGSWEAHKADLVQRRAFRDLILRRLTPQGARYVAVAGAPIFDAEGVFSGYRGIAKDVTALKQAEEDARTAREVLAKILDAVPDPVFVKDEAHRFTHLNDACCLFLGRPRDELLGRSDYDFFPKEQADVFRAKDDVVFASGAEDINEEALTSQDGRTRTISTKKRAIRLPDGRQVLVGVIRDISDLKQQQHLLFHAKEAAEAASRAKSEFLARMSHEIRTPMNGVLGMTELLRATPLTTEQRRFVDTVHGSGEALLRIINDILDFSKIEAGKLELEVVDFSVADCVSDTVELLRGRASAKGLALQVHTDAAVPPCLRGDPSRLRQVLTNLVGNAVKFTERGVIQVDVELVRRVDRHAVIRFAVTDSGIGIASDAQEHVFDAFAQADGSTSRRYGGTGLGLAICRQLAELLGGEIGLRSRLGEGSTFWFTARFPVGDAVPAVAPAVSGHGTGPAQSWAEAAGSRRAHAGSTRILLAEDNPVNREVALAMLSSLGVVADTATNGREAVDASARTGYDLVLMDCQMPDMDGFAATGEIRTREANAGLTRVPIVALTANAMRGDREACIAAGMDDYLSKPFTRAQLQALLERWLGLGENERPAA